MQTFEQPSPLTKLLSSHSSGDSFIPLPQSAQILVPEQLPLQPSEHICPVQVFTAQEQLGIHLVPAQVPPQPSEHVDPIGVLTAQAQLGTQATQMKEQPYAEISFVKFGLNTLCVARFPSPNLPSTPCPQHNTLESLARIPHVRVHPAFTCK